MAQIMKKQAIVNSGLSLILRTEQPSGEFLEQEFIYSHGIADYCAELAEDR